MKWVVFFVGFVLHCASAEPLSGHAIVERANTWMQGNPVMSASGRTVSAVERFPAGATAPYSVYVVHLAPQGYLVLNSDDRLPLVVSFSPNSSVDLVTEASNTFREMLLGHIERMANELAQTEENEPLIRATSEGTLAEDELYGPFLTTSWNQNNPYNLLCPADPAGSANSYDFRASVGCVPLAYAQVMNYHRWPVSGIGSHAYTDNQGSIVGNHMATFSDPYDWSSMSSGYGAFGGNSAASEAAVSELTYELGVAAEVDYDSDGTSGFQEGLGHRLGDFFYYEPVQDHSTLSALTLPLETDLRAGFPAVVSIPGHSIVADGLMVSGGNTFYHINYGWGGSNNGWWTASGVPGGTISQGITSLRPRLMAFPATNEVSVTAGNSLDLEWILPRRREGELSTVTLHQLKSQAGLWSSDASAITASISVGWDVVAGGHSGSCWYGGPTGPASMVLDEMFVPDAATQLSFWYYYKLLDSAFSVSISTDSGESYTELFSVTDGNYNSWVKETISLAAYAGQQVLLKFSLSYGSRYYTSGGVWLDDLAMTSGAWFSWEPFVEDLEPSVQRFSDAVSIWDECSDWSGFSSTSASDYKDWAIGADSGVDHCFYKEPGGYNNQEYHLTADSPVTPTVSSRLLLRAKYNLASDGFRVLISVDGSSFSEIWSASGAADWSDIAIDWSAYAGQSVYVRIEYSTGSFYSDGGIWVDSIGIQEVVNPELEGQPIHSTTVSNLVVGTYTLAAELEDVDLNRHGVGPAFTLSVLAGVEDYDGMPDDWERFYGLDPETNDAYLDADGDGICNLHEYISGTVPTNHNSVWKMEANGGVLPEFQSLTGRTYSIEYCNGLGTNDWQILVEGIAGTGEMLDVGDYEAVTNACRFYRIIVQPDE